MSSSLVLHHHGKSKVRVGRVWREGDVHHMVEWTVNTMVDSDMEHAFLFGDNTGMTATDTQKNTCYVVAKRMSSRCSPEEYAIALAKHFVQQYPRISKAKIEVLQSGWKRAAVGSAPHNHGFEMGGSDLRTTFVNFDKQGKLDVISGIKDLKLLKTTQSGYEGFVKDQFTLLPDTRERIMASSVTCTWRYGFQPMCYEAAFSQVKEALYAAFFGPAKGGVYSPAVQTTLYQMADTVIARVPQVESVFLNMPNIHFVPCSPPTEKFADDVYVATSEPHGNIEAVVTRKGSAPHAKF